MLLALRSALMTASALAAATLADSIIVCWHLVGRLRRLSGRKGVLFFGTP